jgi:tetratricopeptide (TPR) repeat protein
LQERRDDSVVHDGPAEELAWTLEVALGDFGRGWEQWERLVGEDGQVGRRAAWAAARQAVRDGDLLRQSALESRLAEECSQGVDEALLVRAALHRAIGGDDDAEIWKKVASTGSEMARLAALMGGELRGEAAGELLGWAADNSQSREERACWLRARSLCMDSEGRMAEAAESVNALMELAPEDYSVALYGRAVARRLGDARAEAALAVKLGELTSDDEKAAIAFADGAKLLEELSELDEARRVWRQVLACRPGDEEAFRRLGRLLRSEQRWEELVGLLSHRITVRGDEAEEVALYLERSRILESRLGDSTTAAADLHRALALDPEEESALLRLGRMYGRDGNHEKAEELLRSCLEHAEQEQLRLTAVFALAEVLELRDRQEEASRLLETELPSELEPQALERLLSHKLRARQWQQGVNVLDRIGETVESRSDKAIVERRKSRLYRELMANEELSNQCLKKAIELDPRELAPLRALVERYREIGKADSADEMLGRAIGTQLQHIRGELEAEPLRNVAELSALAGETERRFWAISALAVLGQLSPEEKQWYDKRCADAMGSGSEPMEQRVWAEDVMHPDAAQETIFGLWQRLQPAADKIFEADLGEMGVGRGDRVTGGSEGVIGEMLSIAEVIGADIEDVYRWRGHGDELRCVPTSSGPVLLVGDDLATGRSAMSFLGRYRLGCLLGACRASTVALLDRPIEEIEMLFVGGVSEGGQSVGHQLEQARVDAMSKKIKKALSRKQRKALGPAAERFARQPFELERWAGGLARTYQRCGLLVAGRLEPAVADATGTTPEQWDAKPADERLDSIRGHSAAEELIEYSVSQGHIEARAAIGLSRNNE